MVRFEITSGFDVSWEGKIWLKEFPFSDNIYAIKAKGKAKSFYSDDEEKIVEVLNKRKIGFEKHGESEKRPVLVKRKKG